MDTLPTLWLTPQYKAFLQLWTWLALGTQGVVTLGAVSKALHDMFEHPFNIQLWLALLSLDCSVIVEGRLRSILVTAEVQKLVRSAVVCRAWPRAKWTISTHSDFGITIRIMEAAVSAMRWLRTSPRVSVGYRVTAGALGPLMERGERIHPVVYMGVLSFSPADVSRLLDAWHLGNSTGQAGLSDDEVIAEHSAEDTEPKYSPGLYKILHSVHVSESVGFAGLSLKRLSVGSVVNVLKVSRTMHRHRVRGQIADPFGWISLYDSKSKISFVSDQTRISPSAKDIQKNIQFSISRHDAPADSNTAGFIPPSLPGTGQVLALNLKLPLDNHCLVFLAHHEFSVVGRWACSSFMGRANLNFPGEYQRRIFQCRGTIHDKFQKFLDAALQGSEIRYLLISTGVGHYRRDCTSADSLFGQAMTMQQEWPDLDA